MYFQFWNINCKIWIGLKHKLNTVFFFESHKCHNFYTSFWSDLYLNSCKIKTSFSLKKVTLNTSCFQSDLSFENYISALLNFIRSVNFSVSSYKNNEFVWLLIQRVARVSCIGRDHPHWFLMHTLSCRSWQEKQGLSIVELQGGKSLLLCIFGYYCNWTATVPLVPSGRCWVRMNWSSWRRRATWPWSWTSLNTGFMNM